MEAKEIGKRIKEYRLKNGLSQRALADALFVSDKTISRWELGNGLPDIELLPKIAELLGISIDQLVGAERESEEENGKDAIEVYREEIRRLEDELREKEKRESEAASLRKEKIKKWALISSAVTLFLVASISLCLVLFRPSYTLRLVGVAFESGKSEMLLHSGDSLPALNADGKTLLGFIDENYSFYDLDSFRMPEREVTLRALIAEEMAHFVGSDGGQEGERVGEHVLTSDGIPATKYVFDKGSQKGSYLQSRPVNDSGDMAGVNVYAPSLGKSLFLIKIENVGNGEATIRYRVENFGTNQGGVDLYTDPVTIPAGESRLLPVYIENSSGYGVFEGCDHYVILDSDAEERVELEIYGYVYLSEQLSAIEITSSPSKTFYSVGETISLDGIEVYGIISNGSTTGRIRITNFTCPQDGKPWSEDINELEISFAGQTALVPIGNIDDYRIAFLPAANIESIGDTNGISFISANYTTAGKLPATKFTFAPGAKNGMEVEAWINQTISQAMANGQNLRIPTFNGKARKLELVVTNEGGEEISFRYYAENWGEDAGGVDVTVGVGETRSFFFEVNTGKSIGCNYALRLLSDVSLETNVVIYGYFICDRELEGISMLSPAEKKIFKVGESFSCDGLVVKANGEMYDEVVIANFKSSVEEGYVFTSDDVGKRAVTISFGDYSLEYEIEINP